MHLNYASLSSTVVCRSSPLTAWQPQTEQSRGTSLSLQQREHHKMTKAHTNMLFPGSPHACKRKIVLQSMESWVGPGNEANSQQYLDIRTAWQLLQQRLQKVKVVVHSSLQVSFLSPQSASRSTGVLPFN